MVKKISGNELKAAAASGVAVVDFSAQWCGPCQRVAPILEEVSDELDGKANFFNIDIDENADAADEYGITNIPAIMVMKDGEVMDMQVGFQPKENVCSFIGQYL